MNRNIIFLFLMLFVVAGAYAQQPITAFSTSTQAATPTTEGSETWGNGNDVYLDDITVLGNVYTIEPLASTLSFVRIDNVNSSGTRCRLFSESINTNNSTDHFATFPVDDNGNCSMETALRENIVNRGALDVFHNVDVGSQLANNIERVDIIFDTPFMVLNDLALLTEAGFLASEKNGNNEYKGAVIKALDSGVPDNYGPLAYIDGTNADYGEPNAALNFRFLENAAHAPHGNLTSYSGNPELVGLTGRKPNLRLSY